jgi:hypothetical protein
MPSLQVDGVAQDVGHLHAAPGWTLLLHVSSGSALKSGLGVMNLQVRHRDLTSNVCHLLVLSMPRTMSNPVTANRGEAAMCADPHGLPVAVSVTLAPPKLYVTPGGGVVPKASALTKKGVPVKSIIPAVA